MPKPRPEFMTLCLAIFDKLEDYFVGEDISALGMLAPKANGRVIYHLRRQGLIQPIEAHYERYAYRKSSASINTHAVQEVVTRVRTLKREQTRHTYARRRTGDTAMAPCQ